MMWQHARARMSIAWGDDFFLRIHFLVSSLSFAICAHAVAHTDIDLKYSNETHLRFVYLLCTNNQYDCLCALFSIPKFNCKSLKSPEIIKLNKQWTERTDESHTHKCPVADSIFGEMAKIWHWHMWRAININDRNDRWSFAMNHTHAAVATKKKFNCK